MSRSANQAILVVDDEPALLRLFQQYLSRLGYSVDCCSEAVKALESFSAEPGKYAVVLADLEMPGMSGEELALKVLRLNPETRILLSSGYPFDLSELPPEVRPQVRFLHKPFLPRTLLQVIEELLGREP